MHFNNIDAKTAFQMGFAARCQEEGLSEKAAAERATRIKAAAGWLSALTGAGQAAGNAIGTTYDAAAKVVGDLGAPLGMLAVGVPIAGGLAAGAAGGYGLAKLNEPDIDEDDIKAQELARTYKIYADRIKSRQAYLQYRKAKGLQ
jgi:hypothetical protein